MEICVDFHIRWAAGSPPRPVLSATARAAAIARVRAATRSAKHGV